MDPNRLHLNFQRGQGNGGQGYDNDRTYPATNERVYPTTPSTFPQPVFQSMQGNQGGNQDFLNSQPQAQNTGNFAAQGNYFAGGNQQYQQQQQQYGQQSQYANYQQPSVPSNQQFSPRGYNANDPNAGLARQFSNQNLGSNQPRQQSPFGRQPTPTGQQQPQQQQQQHQPQPLQSHEQHHQPSPPSQQQTPQQHHAHQHVHQHQQHPVLHHQAPPPMQLQGAPSQLDQPQKANRLRKACDSCSIRKVKVRINDRVADSSTLVLVADLIASSRSVTSLVPRVEHVLL